MLTNLLRHTTWLRQQRSHSGLIKASPDFSTHWMRSSLAASRTSSSLLVGLFLLVLERISSVSAREAIWAGMKCRRDRGTIRYKRLRQPWGVVQNSCAEAVMGEIRPLERSLVSLFYLFHQFHKLSQRVINTYSSTSSAVKSTNWASPFIHICLICGFNTLRICFRSWRNLELGLCQQ